MVSVPNSLREAASWRARCVARSISAPSAANSWGIGTPACSVTFLFLIACFLNYATLPSTSAKSGVKRVRPALLVALTQLSSQSRPAFLVARQDKVTGRQYCIPMRTPEPRLSCCEARIRLAAACGSSTRQAAWQPLLGLKKAGNSSVWYAATVTP